MAGGRLRRSSQLKRTGVVRRETSGNGAKRAVALCRNHSKSSKLRAAPEAGYNRMLTTSMSRRGRAAVTGEGAMDLSRTVLAVHERWKPMDAGPLFPEKPWQLSMHQTAHVSPKLADLGLPPVPGWAIETHAEPWSQLCDRNRPAVIPFLGSLANLPCKGG